MKACFMGLGYIGLPTAIIAAKHGVEIAGVDINAQVVEVTNQGNCISSSRVWRRCCGRYWPPDISRRTPSLG